MFIVLDSSFIVWLTVLTINTVVITNFLEMGVSDSDTFVRNWKAGSSLRFFFILSGCHS